MSILGIVGGIGPLASAEFLKTIYEVNCDNSTDQQLPACILYSDPTIPDRTEAILSGSDKLLFAHLINSLQALEKMGASKTLVCCFTAHHWFPKIPPDLRTNLISLIDIVFEAVEQSKQRHLLLSTNGTRKTQIFQKHNQWHRIEPYITLPEEIDQKKIHHLIYQIKQNRTTEALAELDYFSQKYEVDAFIAGCTEFHILAKHLIKHKSGRYCLTDPLMIVADNIKKYIDA